jgi:dethiobiotin synthetase
MQRTIAIAGIHTGVGKTIASAVLTKALQADYWKPVQAGDLDNSDTITVQQLVGENHTCMFHPEAFRLTQPLSPHLAAAMDGVTIDHTQLRLPQTTNTLLVETAGGLHSPMSDTATMVDFIQHHQLPVILVTRHYLGSINHTLAAIEVLRQRQIPLLGLIVSGDAHEASEQFITNYSGVPVSAHIPEMTTPDAAQVAVIAEACKTSFLKLLS